MFGTIFWSSLQKFLNIQVRFLPFRVSEWVNSHEILKIPSFTSLNNRRIFKLRGFTNFTYRYFFNCARYSNSLILCFLVFYLFSLQFFHLLGYTCFYCFRIANIFISMIYILWFPKILFTSSLEDPDFIFLHALNFVFQMLKTINDQYFRCSIIKYIFSANSLY